MEGVERGEMLAGISRSMVRIYKEQFGRGPTKARSNFAGPDILICSLQNTLSAAERKLAEMGEEQRLRDMRMFFQHATRERFCEAIEEATARPVVAFVSGIDVNEDISAEVFYLQPESGSETATAGRG
jgi:uncharacterized protein YbcI